MTVSKFLTAMSVAGLMCAAAPAALAQTYSASTIAGLKTRAEAGVVAQLRASVIAAAGRVSPPTTWIKAVVAASQHACTIA